MRNNMYVRRQHTQKKHYLA